MKIKKIITSNNILLVSIVALFTGGLFLVLKNARLAGLLANIAYFLIAIGTVMYALEIRKEKN